VLQRVALQRVVTMCCSLYSTRYLHSVMPIYELCVAVCRSASRVLQCVAVCCSVLHCGVVCCVVLQCCVAQSVVACCSVLQRVAVYSCNVLQPSQHSIPAKCNDSSRNHKLNESSQVNQCVRCVAVFCSVSQCVAACYN